MKKIIILIGPLISYLICFVIGGFQLIIQLNSTASVTTFFLFQCIGFAVIGILIPVVSRTIRQEKYEPLTKVFCGIDVLVPLIVWFICLRTGTLFALMGSFTIVYFIHLGMIAYSFLAGE